MRRGMKMLLLGSLFAALLCGTALAANTDGSAAGFYNVKSGTNLTVAAAGMTETVSANVNGGSDYETLYNGSNQLDVTARDTMSGKQYLVLLAAVEDGQLPTAGSQIYYIDQKEATGSNVPFTVLPKLPTNRFTPLTLFVTSDDGKAMKSVSLGYASANGTGFPVAPYVLGMVNDDDVIDAKDALKVLRISGKLETATSNQLLAADVNRSGDVDAKDALKILRYSGKLISSWDEN